jgi:addiction module HigA family antidote
MDSKTFTPKGTIHPGEIVLDYLESLGWTQQDLSRRSGVTPKTISEICNGKTSISPETALAFEKVLGRPSHFWMNLQARYEEAHARSAEREKSKSWIAWAKGFPLREMKKLGWIPEKNQTGNDVTSLLKFMGVSSPESWDNVWGASRVAFRQTTRMKSNEHAIFAWVRATELYAADIRLHDFDEDRLIASVPSLRSCTRMPIDEGLDEARRISALCGVAAVVVPPLPNTGISGLVRWTSKFVILALSLRYKTDDQIWFTFFHEIGHILLHRKQQHFILENAEGDLFEGGADATMQKYEEEANRFAADFLIPPDELHDFIATSIFTNAAIHSFSDKISISPGIVVGRLQREGLLEPHQGNDLKQRVRIHFTTESEG